MSCKACAEGRRRRIERFERLRKHQAEREKRRKQANQNEGKVKYLDSNGEE